MKNDIQDRGAPQSLPSGQEAAPATASGALASVAESAPKHTKQVPTGKSIRELIRKFFPTDSDFNAFCLDQFRSVAQNFSNGMDRTQKLNILIESVEIEQIFNNIMKYAPDISRGYIDKISYEFVSIDVDNEQAVEGSEDAQLTAPSANEQVAVVPFSNEFEYDAFLSYNHRDEGFAKNIVDLLRRRNLNIWFEKDSVAYGDPIDETRLKAVRTSRRIIVLIGEAWRKPWQSLGVEKHVKSIIAAPGQQRVFPVLLPGAPRQERIGVLRHLHALDFRQNYEELILAIEQKRKIPWRAISTATVSMSLLLIFFIKPIVIESSVEHERKIDKINTLDKLAQTYNIQLKQTREIISTAETSHHKTERQLAATQESLKEAEQSRQRAERSVDEIRRLTASGKPNNELLTKVRKVLDTPKPAPLPGPSNSDGGILDKPDMGNGKTSFSPTTTTEYSLILKTTSRYCLQSLRQIPSVFEIPADCSENGWVSIGDFVEYKCDRLDGAQEINSIELRYHRIREYYTEEDGIRFAKTAGLHFRGAACRGTYILKHDGMVVKTGQFPAPP